jgi:hypothetical protein
MPNWVTARITLNGSDENVKKVLDFIRTEDENGEVNLFDFNKVIPMPEELNIESGSAGDWGMRYLLLNAKFKLEWTDDDKDFIKSMEKRKAENEDDFNRMIDLGKKYLMNIAKYGYKDWYDWRTASNGNGWGTKWEPVDVEVDGNIIRFDTAWSFPHPVIKKLSEMFPDVVFEYIYADEDCGSNCSKGTYKNGNEGDDNEYPDTGSNRAYEIYLEVHPESADDLVFVPEENTYKWIDEDE